MAERAGRQIRAVIVLFLEPKIELLHFSHKMHYVKKLL